MPKQRSREFFSSAGIPEDPDVIQMREGKTGNPLPPKIAEKIARFDFEYLKRAFTKILERSGMDAEHLSLVPPERFFRGEGNQYNPVNHLINIEHYFLDEPKPKKSETFRYNRDIVAPAGLDSTWTDWTETEREADLIHAIIHEEIHAISKSRLIGAWEGEESEEKNEVDFQNGYKQVLLKGGEADIFLRDFDEGVTDKLAREITRQYLLDHGWSEQKVKEAYGEVIEVYDAGRYGSYIRLVEALVKKIAKDVHQSQEVVWESIVRGKMEGERFEEQEVVQLFRDAVGEGFLEQLKMSYGDSDQIIKKYLSD
jgi:hypothetical protein